MRFPTLPRLTFQPHGRLGQSDWHAIWISVMRGLAAFIVATAHLRAAMFPAVRDVTDPPLWFSGLAFVSGFAHQAVLVFFVISGWLVGGSLLNRLHAPQAIANYALDRITRLWTVLIPTFLLTLLIALGTGSARVTDVNLSTAGPYAVLTFFGNLVGLQGILVPDYGNNFPLWSLANETWYYVLFPLLAVACTTAERTQRWACAAALILLASLLPLSILVYFIVWLLGVAFSRIRIDCGPGARCAWLILVLAVAVYFRMTGELDEFTPATLAQDLVCSVLYLVLFSSLQYEAPPASRLTRSLSRGGQFFSEFSFSLYVLHVPVIGLLHHLTTTQLGLGQLSPAQPRHALLFVGMLALVVLSAYLSYLVFEARTYRLRGVLKTALLGSPVDRTDAKVLTPER